MLLRGLHGSTSTDVTQQGDFHPGFCFQVQGLKVRVPGQVSAFGDHVEELGHGVVLDDMKGEDASTAPGPFIHEGGSLENMLKDYRVPSEIVC